MATSKGRKAPEAPHESFQKVIVREIETNDLLLSREMREIPRVGETLKIASGGKGYGKTYTVKSVEHRFAAKLDIHHIDIFVQ
ncbi:MAG TPA: hypothetical protein VN976_14810 [Verrucomicrobiae bacterium]|nr:hypothetical protein [Verrucomicrobiae bacterium]